MAQVDAMLDVVGEPDTAKTGVAIIGVSDVLHANSAATILVVFMGRFLISLL
jgi:hypothetical protein